MNIVLFPEVDATSSIDLDDPRAIHLIDVLRLKVGDTFDAGIVDGDIGKGHIDSIETDRIVISLDLDSTPPPLYPLTLIVGFPRPQSARDVLRDATTLGVSRIVFSGTEKGEKSYRSSSLWKRREYRRFLIQGACQAFSTRLPEVVLGDSIIESIGLCQDTSVRIALDNYEATRELGYFTESSNGAMSTTVAIGAERGWSARERSHFRENGFLIAHLGRRVLRVETACVAALSIVLSRFRRFPEDLEDRS